MRLQTLRRPEEEEPDSRSLGAQLQQSSQQALQTSTHRELSNDQLPMRGNPSGRSTPLINDRVWLKVLNICEAYRSSLCDWMNVQPYYRLLGATNQTVRTNPTEHQPGPHWSPPSTVSQSVPRARGTISLSNPALPPDASGRMHHLPGPPSRARLRPGFRLR